MFLAFQQIVAWLRFSNIASNTLFIGEGSFQLFEFGDHQKYYYKIYTFSDWKLGGKENRLFT